MQLLKSERKYDVVSTKSRIYDSMSMYLIFHGKNTCGSVPVQRYIKDQGP